MPKTTQKTFLFTTLSAIVLASSTFSFAQEGTTASGDTSWVGVVTSEQANIRCGANESYYPIATANSGELVLVSGKKQDWLRVQTDGAVFGDAVGYVKYPTGSTSTVLVAGNKGEVLADIEVLANNLESEELYRSWRPICRLKSGDTFEIISTEKTDPGTLHRDSYIVHTVKMPESGNGWIRSSDIRRASDDERASFYGAPANTTKVGKNETNQDDKGTTKSVGVEPSPAKETVAEVSIDTGVAQAEQYEPLSLVELEARWDTITAEPIMGAELSLLLDMYSELLAESEGDIVVAQVAGGRVKQLEVWRRLQSQKMRIEALKEKMALQVGEVDDYQSIMATYGDYAVVGRLALSNTFDGKLRPLMFRVLDQKSGRTLGYLPVNDDFELSGLLGQIVGVTGKSAWSPAWRVTVIDGERFDILSPTTAIVTPDIQ
ncbi:MAG: hypothetical protein H8E86_05555 [Planctomycetes bacterium]|nr:hypothetical protein [Planctomycetota bacterium]